MKQRERFEARDKKNYIRKSTRFLYILKQFPRKWNKEVWRVHYKH